VSTFQWTVVGYFVLVCMGILVHIFDRVFSKGTGRSTGDRSMWSFIFSWPVVAVVGPGLVFLGFGVLSMTPPEVEFAQACFAIGYLVILLKIAWWITFELTEPLWQRAVFIILVFAAVGVLWFSSTAFAWSKLSTTTLNTAHEKQQTPKENFFVKTDAVVSSKTRALGSVISVVYSGSKGVTISPANVALFLSITNLRETPVMLADYTVEVLTDDEQWAPLIRIPAIPAFGSQAYMGRDLAKLNPIPDNSIFLESQLAGKAIQPHNPARGWALFEYPHNYGPGFMQEFKVTIKDYDGVVFVSPILIPSPSSGGGAQMQSLLFSPKTVDMSRAHVKFWSDPEIASRDKSSTPSPGNPEDQWLSRFKDHPPTLKDMFLGGDHINTMRLHDDEIAIQWKDNGIVTHVDRQLYLDFPANAKFAGFYIPSINPMDTSRTAEACMKLIQADAVQQVLNDMPKRTPVVALVGQTTTIQDLTFSGRVLIYHEDFLSITQKADITRAFDEKHYTVRFFGNDSLGSVTTLWRNLREGKRKEGQ
jgi:hypothetical protein